jgi:hypothetical protein
MPRRWGPFWTPITPVAGSSLRADQHETLFRNLAHPRDLIADWITDCNIVRPHSALGYQTPAGFALHMTTAIARHAARDESSARQAIAQPAPRACRGDLGLYPAAMK